MKQGQDQLEIKSSFVQFLAEEGAYLPYIMRLMYIEINLQVVCNFYHIRSPLLTTLDSITQRSLFVTHSEDWRLGR